MAIYAFNDDKSKNDLSDVVRTSDISDVVRLSDLAGVLRGTAIESKIIHGGFDTDVTIEVGNKQRFTSELIVSDGYIISFVSANIMGLNNQEEYYVDHTKTQVLRPHIAEIDISETDQGALKYTIEWNCKNFHTANVTFRYFGFLVMWQPFVGTGTIPHPPIQQGGN